MIYRNMKYFIFIFCTLYGVNSTLGQCVSCKWYFGNGMSFDFSTYPPTFSESGSHGFGSHVSHLLDENGNLLYYSDGVLFHNSEHELILKIGREQTEWSEGHFMPDIANPERLYMMQIQRDGIIYLYHLELGHPDESKRLISKKIILDRCDSASDIAVYYYQDLQKSLVLVSCSSSMKVFLFQGGEFQQLNFDEKKDGLWAKPIFSPSGKYFRLYRDYIKSATDVIPENRIYTFDTKTLEIRELAVLDNAGVPFCFSATENNAYLITDILRAPILNQYNLLNQQVTTLFTLEKGCSIFDLKLGPDKKIYGMWWNGKRGDKREYKQIAVCAPDKLGLDCNLDMEGSKIEFGDSYIAGWSKFINPVYFSMKPYARIKVSGKYCVGSNLRFHAIAPQALAYFWDFGDGSTGSQQTEQHSFLKVGTYTVKLSVVDAEGNTQATEYTFEIQEKIHLSGIRPLD